MFGLKSGLSGGRQPFWRLWNDTWQRVRKQVEALYSCYEKPLRKNGFIDQGGDGPRHVILLFTEEPSHVGGVGKAPVALDADHGTVRRGVVTLAASAFASATPPRPLPRYPEFDNPERPATRYLLAG